MQRCILVEPSVVKYAIKISKPKILKKGDSMYWGYGDEGSPYPDEKGAPHVWGDGYEGSLPHPPPWTDNPECTWLGSTLYHINDNPD